METKKRKKMDSWMWFSTFYACAVEISIFMLLKDTIAPSLISAGISFILAMSALVAMGTYLRG
jgi:hypothetical protein